MELSVMDLAQAIGSWGKSTQSCSATSHALLYSIIASSVLISTIGVYVWLRFIRTQPGVKVCV